MKIKNFKVNKRAVAKLSACVLVVTTAATMLTGCNDNRDNRNNLLEGTILENTCVVTFDDGSKDIALVYEQCDSSEYPHYYSITSGERFSDQKCTGKNLHHYEITNNENITGYLTSDELAKAAKGELNNDDIAAIVNRTVNPLAEETTIQTR